MRITLGMPTLGHVDIRMAAFLYALIKRSSHQVSVIHTPRADICQARNVIIDEFLEGSDDYLLFLDDDNIPEDVGFLDRMVSARRPVISAMVPSRLPDKDGRHRLCIFSERTASSGAHEYVQHFTVPEGPDVFEVANCGMGCVLIEREVVKLVRGEYDRPCEMRMVTYFNDGEWVRDERVDFTKVRDGMVRFRRYMSEDLIFFERARDFGVKIYCDKSSRCSHIGENKIVTVKNDIHD